MSADNAGVVQRLTSAGVLGNVTVEVIDENAEPPQYRATQSPQKREYRTVDLLSNGWLRAVDRVEDTLVTVEGTDTEADYYPPGVVNRISTVETGDDALTESDD